MFPAPFPSVRIAREGGALLASSCHLPSRGLLGGKRAPSPPISGSGGSQESAWLLRFPGVACRGEPSGERTTAAHGHRPRREGRQDGPGQPGSDARRPSVAQAVRRLCLDCLSLTNARGAFDCESCVCPLYAACPFRRSGRRRATKKLLADYCRHCQPGDQSDCLHEDCALYEWRPWQPGGQPKLRTLTESQKERLHLIGQSSQFRAPRQ